MPGSPYDTDEDWDESEELTLIQRDERLPWLETGEEDEDSPGFDTTRIALVSILAVVLLAAVVGAIWMVTRSSSVSGPEPDGSLIAAPEGPYKTKPDEAGGKVYAGTGDVSFAVGEGESREGQLADKPAPPPAPKPELASTVGEAPRPAQPTGPGVQVGAFPRRADAEAGWVALTRQTEVLNGVSHRVVEGSADIGRVFRLQAVAGDRASAARLCNALKADGIACFVK